MDKASITMRPSIEFGNTLAAPMASEIDELTQRSESLEQRVTSLSESYEVLKRREVELIEWRWVLREAGGFFDRVRFIKFGKWVPQTNVCFRLMGILTRSVNPWITTRPRFFETLSNNLQEGRPKMAVNRPLFL